MKTLTLLIGPPGSGKTTWCKNNVKEKTDTIVICPDRLRSIHGTSINDQTVNAKVWKLAEESAISALNQNFNVIIDACNCKSRDRGRFVQAVKEKLQKRYNKEIKTQAIVFSFDTTECKHRIKQDIKNGIERSNVPDDVVDRMADNYNNGLETLSEQFDMIDYVNKENKIMKKAKTQSEYRNYISKLKIWLVNNVNSYSEEYENIVDVLDQSVFDYQIPDLRDKATGTSEISGKPL